MHPNRAELSSIHGSLEALRERIAGIAERHDAQPDDSLAAQLFEVDRSLRNALRQLDRAMSEMS